MFKITYNWINFANLKFVKFYPATQFKCIKPNLIIYLNPIYFFKHAIHMIKKKTNNKFIVQKYVFYIPI